MSRWTVLLIVVIGTVGVGGWLLWVPAPHLVETGTAERGEIHDYIEERAKTRLPEIYRITMPLDGRVRRITLKERDAVEQGQVVALMDASDLQTDLDASIARIDQFGKLLESMNLAIESAAAQVTAAAAKFEYADKEFRRKSGLAERKAISASERDAAEVFQFESRVDYLKDELTEKALKAMHTALVIAQSEADETRKQNLRDRNRAEIVSPVSGVVLTRHATNERVLQAGAPLLEIGRPGDLEVQADVLTQDAARISPDDRVEIRGATLGGTVLAGKVSRIFPQGFTKVSSLGVEQQRVRVIIAFDSGELEKLRQTDRLLGSDYRVRVRIFTDSHSDAVKIPRSALFRGADGSWQAFVVRRGRAHRVEVQVGIVNDFAVEVLEGVKESEEVILAPETGLTEGQRVAASDET